MIVFSVERAIDEIEWSEKRFLYIYGCPYPLVEVKEGDLGEVFSISLSSSDDEQSLM